VEVHHFFIAVVVLVLVPTLYRVARFKTLRGAMFGARVVSTIGEVEGVAQGLASTRLKVHSAGRYAGSSTRPVHGLRGRLVLERGALE